MIGYEHKLVAAQRVDEYLADGWEPVPFIEPVVTNRSAPEPFVEVFLRRVVHRGRWPSDGATPA